MNKLGRAISYWRDYLILAFAVMLSCYLLFFANHPRQLGGIQTVSLEIIGRLAQPISRIRQWGHLQESNRILRYQNTLLQIKNAQLAEAYYENQRLRQMLGFRLDADYPLLPAKVIGTTGKTGQQSFVLDLGEDKGLQPGMTVVSADGLVGRIVHASGRFATGQTLADPSFRAAAMIQRSRVQGVFQWAGYESGTLIGIYLSADVKVGDVVVTSGLNSMFAAGLKIGTVTQIDDASGGLFKKIYIKAKTDFGKLEEVFVIKNPVTNTAVVK